MSFRALNEVFAEHGLPMSLYTDRGSHYFRATKAGEIDRGCPTQVGRALASSASSTSGLSRRSRGGRSERAFQTLQDRLVKEFALAGITGVEAANAFVRDVYLPAHNTRFGLEQAGPGLGLHADPGRRSRRDPVRAGGAAGWQAQRQLRVLPDAPGEPDAPALRQGTGQGACLSRRRSLPTRSSKPRFDAAAIMFPFSMKLSPPNLSSSVIWPTLAR
jgi:hypothetical protein